MNSDLASIETATDFDIRFPEAEAGHDQDAEWFEFTFEGERRRLKVHDYAALYDVPGLYEALVYETLGCRSPDRVADLLALTVADEHRSMGDLRALDLGAGNGIVAERLAERGVPAAWGADLLPEAKAAAERDRPDAYDGYLVGDFTAFDDRDLAGLRAFDPNLLVVVAALGYGDIPPSVFAAAWNEIADDGLVAFTIKETFLSFEADRSGFAWLVKQLRDRRLLRVDARLRFRHRVSIGGEPLHYVAVVGRKFGAITPELVETCEAMAIDEPTTGDAESA